MNRLKVLSTDHTVYPIDYDLNGKSGYAEWRDYIHQELYNQVTPCEIPVIEAKKILLSNTMRIRKPLTREQHIKGDRWIYAAMFITVIILAIVLSL